MPLTRHLYEIDEVVAALQLCLRSAKSNDEGLFWLWELVMSEETMLAQKTLVDHWIYSGSALRPPVTGSWVDKYVNASASTESTESTISLLAQTATMPDRPTVTPRPSSAAVEARRNRQSAAFVASMDDGTSKKEAAAFWISLDSACRQHSRVDALWLLQAGKQMLTLSDAAIWSALRIAARGPAENKSAIEVLQRLGSETPEKQLLYQACAVILLCYPSTPPETAWTTAWTTWTANAGRRQVRVYAIPPAALHVGTTRGQISAKYTNIADIREPVGLLSESCRFWQSALKKYGIDVDEESGSMAFPSDDVLEAFHARHFPDDIPDEWSKQDQEKSHGRGCKETAAPAPPSLTVPSRSSPVSRRDWNCAIMVRS